MTLKIFLLYKKKLEFFLVALSSQFSTTLFETFVNLSTTLLPVKSLIASTVFQIAFFESIFKCNL